MRLAVLITGVLAALCGWCASACPSSADTQIGVQGLVLSGTHGEPNASYSGTGAGALIQLDQRWQGIGLHLEGIPDIATANIRSGEQSLTATIGLFAATARFAVDPHRRFWIGAGTELLGQRTPYFDLGRLYSSRLAGTRFEVDSLIPTSTDHFIETDFGAVPALNGDVDLIQFFSNGTRYTLSGAERASMIDLAAAYGIRRGRFEYLYGLRSLNFAAKFADGREADRNVGVGVTAAIRFTL